MALKTATDTIASPTATDSKVTAHTEYVHKQSLSPGAVAGITASCMIVFFIISALLLRKKLVQSFTKESGSKSRAIEMANDTSIYEVGSNIGLVKSGLLIWRHGRKWSDALDLLSVSFCRENFLLLQVSSILIRYFALLHVYIEYYSRS